jgi:ELWxxDGT repeat protein
MANMKSHLTPRTPTLLLGFAALMSPTSSLAVAPDITVEPIDVNVGPDHGHPSDPVIWNGQLFFSAKDAFACSGSIPGEVTGDELGEYGRELFTAGINTGPILVKDINVQLGGNCSGVGQLLQDFAAGFNDALIFRARPYGYNDPGFQPWRTQGTDATTEMVADIRSGTTTGSRPYGMTAVFGGTHVVFGATQGLWGTEPWITDGTSGGTRPAGNIAPDDYDSNPYYFTPLSASQFVFVADDDDVGDFELYVSDGTTSTLIKDIHPVPYRSSDIQLLTSFVGKDKAVFYAYDDSAGREPWVTDGTPAGTFRLADINPGTGSSNTDATGDNAGFVQVGTQMFFSADDGTTGRELWVTDGTSAGTRLVTEIVAGSGGGYFAQAAAFQGKLWFAAPGIGLWYSDGTSGGTTPLVEGIFPGALRELTAVGDLLYFTTGGDLWVSDGTVAGTLKVPGFDPTRLPEGLTAVNNNVLAFWAETSAVGREMFLAYPSSLGPDTEGPIVLPITPPSAPLGTYEDWYFTATAHDTLTGNSNIFNIEFQLDGGEWYDLEPFDAYDSPNEIGIDSVRFTTIGIHELCARGIDEHFNVGDPTCVDVPVASDDTTPPAPPQVSASPNPMMVDTVTTLSITGTDVGTGDRDIILIEYQIDGGSWQSILTPLDGAYDEPTETATELLTFDTPGVKNLCGRTTDDGFNTSSAGCTQLQVNAPEATLRLRAIEVNQVIQNWRNTVPLFSQKPTIVRVFIEKLDAAGAHYVNGVLHGSTGGSPLPGSPLVSEGRAITTEDATAFTLVDQATMDSWRDDPGHSVNFVLPPNWINRSTPVELEFALTNPADGVLGCEEPDGNPDCSVGINFETSEVPLVELFAVPYNRNEIRQLTVNATGGSYRFTAGPFESFEIPFDSGSDIIERAVEDVKGAKDNRVKVATGACPGGSLMTGNNYRITILRGQSEILDIDTSGLTGTATLTTCETGGPSIAPGDRQLKEQVRRMRDQFPTYNVDYRFRTVSGFNRAPTLFKVNQRLSKVRWVDAAIGGPVNKLKSIGFLFETGPESTGAGLAWTATAAAYMNFVWQEQAGGRRRNTGVHELAHTFGRAHAVFLDQGALGSIGLCGSKFNDFTSPLHPFIEDTGIYNWDADQLDASLSTTWPTIGPLDLGPDDEVWGFSPRAFANGPGFEHLVVVDPRYSAELMSYCDIPGNAQDRWISTFSYDKLNGRLRTPDHGHVKVPQGGFSTELFLVAGAFNEETSEYELEPITRINGVDPGSEPGGVHIALLDAGGSEIASRDVLLLQDGNHPGLSDGPAADPPAFMAVIPVPAGQEPATVTVTLDAQELVRASASLNPPTVTITSPTAATVASETIPIAWTASDLDGDNLFTTILLSTDNGISWETIGVDVEGSSYPAPTSYLEGSASALIRLLVSDGFHTTEATSQSFTLDAGYPLVLIDVPVNGIAVPTDQVLHLRGDGWDPEDGVLEGSRLEWTVEFGEPFPSQDLLGFGEAVDIPASQLPQGCQLILLTATDSDGHHAHDTVEVDIGGTGCLHPIFDDGFESGNLSTWSSSAR